MDPSDHDTNDSQSGAPDGNYEPTHVNGAAQEWNDRVLRSVLENSSEVVKVMSPDGTLRYASPAFARVLGYDPGEVVGTMNVLDLVHPDDLPHVLEKTECRLIGSRIVDRPRSLMLASTTPIVPDRVSRGMCAGASIYSVLPNDAPSIRWGTQSTHSASLSCYALAAFTFSEPRGQNLVGPPPICVGRPLTRGE